MWLRKPRLRSILHEKAKIHNVGGEVANTPGIEELASTIYAFAPASDVALKAASESCKPHEIAKALMARANSDLIRQMVAAAPFRSGIQSILLYSVCIEIDKETFRAVLKEFTLKWIECGDLTPVAWALLFHRDNFATPMLDQHCLMNILESRKNMARFLSGKGANPGASSALFGEFGCFDKLEHPEAVISKLAEYEEYYRMKASSEADGFCADTIAKAIEKIRVHNNIPTSVKERDDAFHSRKSGSAPK